MLLHIKEKSDKNLIYCSNLNGLVTNVNALHILLQSEYGDHRNGVPPILEIMNSASLVYITYNHLANVEEGKISEDLENLYSMGGLLETIRDLIEQINRVFNIEHVKNPYSFKHYPWYQTGVKGMTGAHELLHEISREAERLFHNVNDYRASTLGSDPLRNTPAPYTPPSSKYRPL